MEVGFQGGALKKRKFLRRGWKESRSVLLLFPEMGELKYIVQRLIMVLTLEENSFDVTEGKFLNPRWK